MTMNQNETTDICNVQHEIADPSVMASTPLVSVHMITYNHGPYLAEAIESVIAQRAGFPFELVIGEDCSTDDTREVALDYQRRYPHLIRVIYSDRNVGMWGNCRRVAMACRGEYIAFCEGDDYWINPGKLQKQVEVLSRFNNIDITFHSCYSKSGKHGKEILSTVNASTDKLFTLPEVIGFTQGHMPTASILVRRSVFISTLDWFDAAKPPIMDYFIRVFGARRGGAYYLGTPMSVYRQDIGVSWSDTTQNKLDKFIEFQSKFILAIIKLEDEIPGQEEAFKRFLAYHYSSLPWLLPHLLPCVSCCYLP